MKNKLSGFVLIPILIVSILFIVFGYLLISKHTQSDEGPVLPQPLDITPRENAPDACNLEPDPGNCYGNFPSYYFDKEEDVCKEFVWGGCDGTRPFRTLSECQTACEQPRQISDTAIKVSSEDQSCLDDADCSLIESDCSGCECSRQAVNVNSYTKYQEIKVKKCENFEGPYCELECPPTYTAKCRNNICEIAELE